MSELENFFKSYAESEELLDFKLAHEVVAEKTPVISTGSLLLDEALSCGGLPKGRIIQLYGKASSGKTLLSLISIVEAQKMDPTAYQMFIDAEGTFSSTWAEQLGADISKIIVVSGDTAVNGRSCFEMLLGIPKEDAKHVLVGKSKEGFLDKIAAGKINCNLIILDSLGAIIPPGEDTSKVGKMNMSLLARFLTTTFRKLSLEVKKANLVFIVINHKKDGMDMYGPDHTFSGGNSYTHTLSANIYFEAVQRKDAMVLDEKENKIGHTIRATVEKSKFGMCPKKCEFKVEFSVGIIDRHEEIAQLALDYDVVIKPTSVSHEYGDRKWVGYEKFINGVKSDPKLAQELTVKISEAREAKLEKKRVEQKAKKALLELIADDEENSIKEEASVTEETNKPKRGRKPKELKDIEETE
jgi:recombination protein RecA